MAILGQFISQHRFIRWRALLLIWVAGLGSNSLWAQAISHEYQLKAVFLYNFAQFAEWPTNAFADSSSPVIIGVLGKNPYAKALEETVKGERVDGRSLTVKSFGRVEDIKECHVLFISQSEASRLKQILASLNGRSILTVGEMDNFVQNGGMICFLTEKNKIRLRINPNAVKRANLTLSSKLLRLAEMVPDERN